MEGVLRARSRPPARRAQVQRLRADALPAHPRVPLVHGPRVDVAGGVRARDDLLLRDRRARDPARLQGADAVRGRADRARRAARQADGRRGASGHRESRSARLHSGAGGERGDRQAGARGLPGPGRSHGAAPVHADGGARARAGVAAARVKFGLGLSVQHLPDEPQAVRFREHVEQVRLARAVGFPSGWASQHYLSDPFTYFQPIPTLARLAADARGLTLGTGVLLLPLHHPVDIAEQLATLDVIADGRLVCGVGLGYRDVENTAMGHDPKQRVGRLVEGLEVLERLWSGEPVDYEGRHFNLRSVRISMRPMQSPRPPIWLAANSDGGVRRAARLGDAWLLNPHATLPTLERQQVLFRSTRRELGRPAATETPLIKECYVAPDSSAAFAEAAAFLDAKYRAYRRWEQDKALPAGESFAGSFEDLARDRFVLGDPVRVAEEIARYRERLGVTTMIFRLQWPGMDNEKVLRSIRLLGTKVLPKFLQR